MTIDYRNQGVCSSMTHVTVNDETHIIEDVTVIGGCNGNLQGISRLLVGMKAEDAIARMKGVQCGRRPTSCPDQISKALETCLAKL